MKVKGKGEIGEDKIFGKLQRIAIPYPAMKFRGNKQSKLHFCQVNSYSQSLKTKATSFAKSKSKGMDFIQPIEIKHCSVCLDFQREM